MIKKAEFKVGDVVTFKPYESSHTMVVIKVEALTIHEGSNNKLLYHLTDARYYDHNGWNSTTTKTTGKCITESKFFSEGE